LQKFLIATWQEKVFAAVDASDLTGI